MGGFDDFDAFSSDDSFNLDSGETDFDFGDEDTGFDSDKDMDFGESNIDNSKLSDAFNTGNTNNEYADIPQQNKEGTKKIAIIYIVVGVIVTVLILVIATKIGRNRTNNTVPSNNTAESTVNNNTSNSEIMSDTSAESNKGHQSVYYSNDSDMGWIEITNHEEVNFDKDYKEFQFTITDIKHYARSVDNQNNLVIKTVLTGAISGLTGSYTIEVPYDKGVLLSTSSDSFVVYVKVGTYNGKRVVGDIKY